MEHLQDGDNSREHARSVGHVANENLFFQETELMAKHITALMIEITVKSISRKWEEDIAKIGTLTVVCNSQ